MTDIDDATCTGSSYGSTLVAAGGTGLVAWTKQLSKTSSPENCKFIDSFSCQHSGSVRLINIINNLLIFIFFIFREKMCLKMK